MTPETIIAAVLVTGALAILAICGLGIRLLRLQKQTHRVQDEAHAMRLETAEYRRETERLRRAPL